MQPQFEYACTGQIKQTTACNVAMAGSICIINNSYHETFFMKFSPVLSAIRAGNKGANIEKVRVCLACKCNAPTSHCQASDRCSEERRGLHCSAVQLEHISHAKCGSQRVVCEGRLSRSVPWVLQGWHEVIGVACHAALTQDP